MYFKHFFAATAVMFLMLAFSSNTQAQLIYENPEICKECGPNVAAINVFPFPWHCDVMAFGAVVGGYGRCKTLGYTWTTNDPGATIQNAGGNCKINFSGPGTYDVCVVYTKWLDLDGDNFPDANELCGHKMCIQVEVCN